MVNSRLDPIFREKPTRDEITGILCAVLLTPPKTSGARTKNRVADLTALLGFEGFTIVNIFDVSCVDLSELGRLGVSMNQWLESRVKLTEGLAVSNGLLAAWGVSKPNGPARHHMKAQVDWLLGQASILGHTGAWTIGCEPRHPSRWHQFVADRHGRTSGGSPSQRLRQVAQFVPLSDIASNFRMSSSHREPNHV